MIHVDLLSLLKTSKITTNMQILQTNTLPINLLKSSVQECNHSQPTTAEDLHTNLTFDQAIRLLHNQDITITMIAKLQPNNIALFNSEIAAQDRLSDPFHQSKQTKGVLQTTTLQDKIPAHPTQQILYATTVEDSATMLIDAKPPTVNHKLAPITKEDPQTEIQTMKMLNSTTSMPISSLIQCHHNHMLSTIKHTLPHVTTRTLSMAH